MTPFQWLFLGFSVVQLCRALLRIRRQRSAPGFALAAVWLAAIVLLLNPDMTTVLANRLGIGRGADLMLYVMFFFMFWAHYQQYLRYKRVESHITLLVRELAIARADVPQGKPDGGQADGTQA
jgi:hypothetical protein